MATQSSSTTQAQQRPPKAPPPPAAVSLVSSALTATLTPLFAFDMLSRALPIFGLAVNEFSRPALRLALQEVERYTPVAQLGHGYAQREVIGLNQERRAGYIVAATRRIAEALEEASAKGTPPEAALASARALENRYLNQHAQASAQRVIAAGSIDALANTYGAVLGWYARNDDRTTAECKAANGKNFRVDNPPDIGYPGIVHMSCRCRAGVPHVGAEELPGGTSAIAAANAHDRRRVLEFVRRVRTQAGVERFDEPIGTPITAEMEHEAEFKKAAARAHRNATARARRTGTTTAPARGTTARTAVRADDARKTQGQTKSNFVNPYTGKPMTKTEIGDTYEELFERHGAELLAKKFPGAYTPISGESGGSRTTPLDFRLNHTFGGELKTLSSRSENQKTAIKKDEIERKLNALTGSKLKPLLVVQVVDQDTGTISVYAFPNFVSKAVRAMEYVGSYKYTDEQFKEAQIARKQWKGGA